MAVKYMSPEQMSQQTGVSLPVMHKVFEAAEAKRYPRLFIKTKGQHRGRLVVQGDATYDAVISAANKVAKSLGQSPAQAGTAPLVVPIGEFAEACMDAIESARGLTRRHSSNKQYQNLMCWSVDAEAGGAVGVVRLDIACALAKRMSRLPEDAYGEEIQGAMLVPAGDHKKWVVSYDMSSAVTTNSPDSGNIDHVIPRSAGGSPCLCNLQVMRVRSNTEKSSDVLPDVSGEPQESLRVLEALQRGARGAAAEGRISDATLDAFDRILCTEISECLSMLKTREVAAVIARKGARRAGRCLGNAIRDAAGAVVRAPRRLAIRYATRLISEP